MKIRTGWILLVVASATVLCNIPAHAQIGPGQASPAQVAPGSGNPGARSSEPGAPAPNTPNAESAAVPAANADAAATMLSRIEALYGAAAYEDALAAMPPLDGPVMRDVEQYRALCLVALGRQNEAAAAVERVLSHDPLFVPSGVDTPPRLQAMYADVRLRIVPEAAKAAYAEGKAAWARKDTVPARAAFQRTVDIIGSVPPAAAPGLDDLRELASGVLQLTSASATPQPAVAAGGGSAVSSLAGPTGSASKPVGTAGVNWQAAVAVRQDMPSWLPPDSISRRQEYQGRIRLSIDGEGHVAEVKVEKPSHPMYDAAIIRAARDWTFTPATRNGVPIPSEKEIEVHLKPQ
jgi:TonB family protein